MKDRVLLVTLIAALAAAISGCKVEVNHSRDGGEDNVKIKTPFGGIAVNQDQASSAELGIPAYPNAVETHDNGKNRSAKIDMDFGTMRMRVKVAHYTSQDPQEQIIAFYRKALTRYGDVIECVAGKPTGPAATAAGLTCDSSGRKNTGTEGKEDDIELKAGSVHHQHLVVFTGKTSPPTEFALIALDLPHGFDLEQKGTN
jgi:hypothetical protein